MNDRQCGSCENFRQHYTLSDGRLIQVYCGHCTFFPTPKRKRPQDKACDNFIQGSSKTENFASKEYLTKTLLRRVLELPLLPEIQDPPGDAKNRGTSK